MVTKFYSDYVRDLRTDNHVVIIVLACAYLQYGSWGYERTVGYDELVWC